MKTMLMRASMLTVLFSAANLLYAQEDATTSMRDYLSPEKTTRNVFEEPKGASPEYDGIKVVVGGDFALQFQALKHSTEAASLGNLTGTGTGTVPAVPNTLNEMGSDFNLPTANLDVNAYLAKGVKMHLRTYLSARHHNEAWVKGGFIQIDDLDFISPGFLGDIMKYARVKVGMDEINYGDTHFRRTDNARAITNPLVGNYIMDSFTTEAFGEVYGFYNNFIGMVGVSNGKLNQTAYKGNNWNSPSVYAKIGWDKQVNSDLRVRLTGSFIQTNGWDTGGYLYGGDRAGSRYYYTLLTANDEMKSANYATGRFNPGFKKMQAFQVNPFVKYNGLEFFGVYEYVKGQKTLTATRGSYTQLAAELLYRFGGKEQFYVVGRYNNVTGKDNDDAATLERKIDRFNIGGGWFMTKNILAKVEYVNQKYNNSTVWGATSALQGGKFNGLMLEATIGF